MDTFSIETAVEKWRASLTASEGISKDAIDELESHLRESTAKLTGNGLSEEEAFLIASRRLGKCEALDHEFSSVSSHIVWKRRVVWMLIGFIDISALLLAISLIGRAGTWAAVAFGSVQTLPVWSALSYVVPVLLFAIAGIFIWRWILRGSPGEMEEIIGRYPLYFAISALGLLLFLKAGSFGITMVAARTIPMEGLGKIAVHSNVSNVAIGTAGLLVIGAVLAILGKSLLPAKTS